MPVLKEAWYRDSTPITYMGMFDDLHIRISLEVDETRNIGRKKKSLTHGELLAH